MSITLPVEMADSVRAKVARGDYASESEVIREGLRALEAQEEAVEQWLRTEVKAIAARIDADPSRGTPAEEVYARMERLRDQLREKDPAKE